MSSCQSTSNLFEPETLPTIEAQSRVSTYPNMREPAPTRNKALPWALIGSIGMVMIIGLAGCTGSGTETIEAEEEPSEQTTTPTKLPTLTATITPAENCHAAGLPEIACTGVSANDDWTPIVKEFSGVQLALVPAGCFMIGNSEDETDYIFDLCEETRGEGECNRIWFDDEQPQQEVCFDTPFWIDVYEVTNRQYGSSSVDCLLWSSGGTQPRICLSWHKAVAYCESLGGRLPTEAEWEYAARGPDGLVFPWGNEFVADHAVYADTSDGEIADIGSKQGDTSWVGAIDLSGNVPEWVNSLYLDYPYDPGDGREAATESYSFRVLRGGSWGLERMFLPSTRRDKSVSVESLAPYGFRCAYSGLEPEDYLSIEPPPTDTPTPIPTPTREPLTTEGCLSAGLPAIACTGPTRNADWAIITREFDDVQMALVPAGCFMMGSSDEEVNNIFEQCEQVRDECDRSWFEDQQPQHEICFNMPFWIDVYEVTNRQYGSATDRCAQWSTENNQPLICVDWFDAVAHCESRGARLPTEAEWEYAARGPDGLLFPWGNEYLSENLAVDIPRPAIVGSIPGGVSWIGAYDLSGNVQEWVSSIYMDYPYDPGDGREADGSIDFFNYRVLRGGASIHPAHLARGASRDWNSPGSGINSMGFRCARDYEGP